jgi:phage shock protein A
MALLRRFTSIFRAKASKALDRIEDPRETLDYSYERQLDLLQKMRRGVADVATSRKRIELQAQSLQRSAAKLETQARQALAQSREDLAREALLRRQGIANELGSLQTQHDQLRAEEQKLVEASRRLEAKVQAFRTRKETIKATYTAAEAQTRVNEAISGISEEMGDVGMAMQRAEDKVAQMQARATALDELVASGALDDLTNTSDPLQAELDRGMGDMMIEAELSRLRGELSGSTGPRTLGKPSQQQQQGQGPAQIQGQQPAPQPAQQPAQPAAQQAPPAAPPAPPAQPAAPPAAQQQRAAEEPPADNGPPPAQDGTGARREPSPQPEEGR